MLESYMSQFWGGATLLISISVTSDLLQRVCQRLVHKLPEIPADDLAEWDKAWTDQRLTNPNVWVPKTIYLAVLALLYAGSVDSRTGRSDAYLFLVGILAMPYMDALRGHVSNVFNLWDWAKHPDCIKGRLSRSAWMRYRSAARDQFLLAALLVFLYMLHDSFFLLGGIIGCLLSGLNFHICANRMTPTLEEATTATTEKSHKPWWYSR